MEQIAPPLVQTLPVPAYAVPLLNQLEKGPVAMSKCVATNSADVKALRNLGLVVYNTAEGQLMFCKHCSDPSSCNGSCIK